MSESANVVGYLAATYGEGRRGRRPVAAQRPIDHVGEGEPADFSADPAHSWSMGSTDLDAAAAAIRRGELVVYPTETVYGLGADALDEAAIRRVFDVKRRPRDDPLSLAVESIDRATEFVRVSEPVREFMAAFLPGPVTVICEKTPAVPDVLVGGRGRVGIRIPDHVVALALLERASPITATSANVSGRGSVTQVSDLDSEIRDAAAVVVDGGETPGTESTVVDPERGVILRRGAIGDRVEAWLDGR